MTKEEEERERLNKQRTVRLTTCFNSYDARILKDALASEGIDCVLGNENMSNFLGGFIAAFSGVDVFVFENDLDSAMEVYKRLYGEDA